MLSAVSGCLQRVYQSFTPHWNAALLAAHAQPELAAPAEDVDQAFVSWKIAELMQGIHEGEPEYRELRENILGQIIAGLLKPSVESLNSFDLYSVIDPHRRSAQEVSELCTHLGIKSVLAHEILDVAYELSKRGINLDEIEPLTLTRVHNQYEITSASGHVFEIYGRLKEWEDLDISFWTKPSWWKYELPEIKRLPDRREAA